MTDFGLDESFRSAVNKVQEHYGFEVPISSLRNQTLNNAQRISDLSCSNESANLLSASGADHLIAEADGSMVAMVRFQGKSTDRRKIRKIDYKEVRLCACKEKGKERTFYRAKVGNVEQIGKLWSQCAKEAGRGLNSYVHAVCDGAQWIAEQAQNQLKCNRFLVDFYHVCEYLKAAQPSCATNNRWYSTQKNRLLSNRSDRVLQSLSEHQEAEHLPDQEAPVRCAHRYLKNRIAHLDYKASKEQALPIGSGLIESGHKHVIQARMKIAGAAWSEGNADLFIQTRAQRASGRWQEFWKN